MKVFGEECDRPFRKSVFIFSISTSSYYFKVTHAKLEYEPAMPTLSSVKNICIILSTIPRRNEGEKRVLD